MKGDNENHYTNTMAGAWLAIICTVEIRASGLTGHFIRTWRVWGDCLGKNVRRDTPGLSLTLRGQEGQPASLLISRIDPPGCKNMSGIKF